jgi:hypothetical protein
VFLPLHLQRGQALQLRRLVRLLPVLGLVVLDPQEGVGIEVADGSRAAAVAKLVGAARDKLALEQAARSEMSDLKAFKEDFDFGPQLFLILYDTL